MEYRKPEKCESQVLTNNDRTRTETSARSIFARAVETNDKTIHYY